MLNLLLKKLRINEWMFLNFFHDIFFDIQMIPAIYQFFVVEIQPQF